MVHAQRRRNCNVTFAVSGEIGLVHHRIAFETVTRERFEEFLADTARECENMFPADEPVFLVFDNARPHVRAQLPAGINQLIQLKRLPPYSPFLNMTEMAHSSFKAGVKRDLALPEWQLRLGDREAAHNTGVNLQQWRGDLIQEVAQHNVGQITHENCVRWYNNSQTYIPRCLTRQNIEG